MAPRGAPRPRARRPRSSTATSRTRHGRRARRAGLAPLQPVLSIKARVVAVRDLPAGARPSYGRRRALGPRPGSRPSRSATPTAYPRALLDGGAEVLIRGRRRPLAGHRSRWTSSWSSATTTVEVGDEVVLLGRQGDEVGGRRRVGAPRSARSAGRSSAGSSRASRSSPSSDPGTIAPMGAGTLEALAAQAATCTACRLSETRTTVVFGMGSAQSGLLVRRRGPGPRRGPPGAAVRRAVRPAPRPADLRGARPHPGVLLHRERGQVPPAREPRPRPRRGRGLLAVPRKASSTPLDPSVVLSLGNVATRVLLETDEGISHAARPCCTRGVAGCWCRPSTPPTRCAAAAAWSPRCARTSCARSRRSPRRDEPHSGRHVRLGGRHAPLRRAPSPPTARRVASWSSPGGSVRARPPS